MAWLGSLVSGAVQAVTSPVVSKVVGTVKGYVGGTTKFDERFRSLEIEVINKTNSVLRFESSHFATGEWFTGLDHHNIHPGNKSFGRAANRQGNPEGVKGGVKFEIESTGVNFYIGFENPVDGDYKSFIAVDENKSAQWACDENRLGSSRSLTSRGYFLSCSPEEPTESEFKKFVFIIRKYKNKFVEPKTASVTPSNIEVHTTKTIVMTDSSGRFQEVAGGLEYFLKGPQLFLYISFQKTAMGSYKTFIDVRKEKATECAWKEADTDGVNKEYGDYTLLASIEDENQTLSYTIKKEMPEHEKKQAFQIINETPQQLLFKNKYFSSETWTLPLSEPSDPEIRPRKPKEVIAKDVIVAELHGSSSEIKLGLEFEIKKTKLSLYIDFYKSSDGEEKYFMQVTNDKTAKWAADGCLDNSNKGMPSKIFQLTKTSKVEDGRTVNKFTIRSAAVTCGCFG